MRHTTTLPYIRYYRPGSYLSCTALRPGLSGPITNVWSAQPGSDRTATCQVRRAHQQRQIAKTLARCHKILLEAEVSIHNALALSVGMLPHKSSPGTTKPTPQPVHFVHVAVGLTSSFYRANNRASHAYLSPSTRAREIHILISTPSKISGDPPLLHKRPPKALDHASCGY